MQIFAYLFLFAMGELLVKINIFLKDFDVSLHDSPDMLQNPPRCES